MDPEREVGERFELVVAGCYHLLTPFTAVAEQRCIIAHQNNHRDAVAELREDLLDEPRVRLMESDVDAGKRFVTRRELPPFGEFALRIWVRQLQGVLMPHLTRAEGISDIEGKVARVSGERVGQRPSFKSMHPRISR